jgi:hypothetical protein
MPISNKKNFPPGKRSQKASEKDLNKQKKNSEPPEEENFAGDDKSDEII